MIEACAHVLSPQAHAEPWLVQTIELWYPVQTPTTFSFPSSSSFTCCGVENCTEQRHQRSSHRGNAMTSQVGLLCEARQNISHLGSWVIKPKLPVDIAAPNVDIPYRCQSHAVHLPSRRMRDLEMVQGCNRDENVPV